MKAVQTGRPAAQTGVGLLQVGIIVLTLVTALIHLVVLNYFMLNNPEYGRIDPLFTLNGLGYLALLAALFLPLPVVRENRRLVRYALIGFTAVTIIAWVIMGRPYTPLGWFTKAVEALLIVLLVIDSRK